RHTRSYGDWSSDVCSSDLSAHADGVNRGTRLTSENVTCDHLIHNTSRERDHIGDTDLRRGQAGNRRQLVQNLLQGQVLSPKNIRSEEHTSELQSPYDLVCR